MLTLLEAFSRYFPVKIRPVSVTNPTPVVIPTPCGCVNDEVVLILLPLLPGLLLLLVVVDNGDDDEDDVPLLDDRCDDDGIIVLAGTSYYLVRERERCVYVRRVKKSLTTAV